MLDIREPKFQWGQQVVAQIDLVNDGSYPDTAQDALLVASGSQGEVVQTGMHEESNTPIYLVEFPNGKVIGCLEAEIAPAAIAASPLRA
ncbi:MAG TPA: nitrogen fixation protein NifZ [Gallionellaceae bacterium]|nr:nitrogen fixation protein NifZ [Gallionellaceae bacterium]